MIRLARRRVATAAGGGDTVTMGLEATDIWTAEDLAANDIPNKSTELVRGRLIVREPPSSYHGRLAANLVIILGAYVRSRALGDVFAQDSGFKIASSPDTVRAPDVAFLAAERAALIPERGYAALAPDFIVEILSPDDRPGEVLAKIGEWLEAGVRLAWVIDPRRREARVYRRDGSVRIAGAADVLDGEDVIPGFTCSLKDILGSAPASGE
jgi:Uma2 family endonuclease